MAEATAAGGALALTDAARTLTDEEVWDVGTALGRLDPETRSLVATALLLPEHQRQALQLRLAALPEKKLEARDGPTDPAIAKVTEVAVSGGAPYYAGILPRGLAETRSYEVGDARSQWFYVLKCSWCGRVAITQAGNGDTPVGWAREHKWSTPASGRQRWGTMSVPGAWAVRSRPRSPTALPMRRGDAPLGRTGGKRQPCGPPGRCPGAVPERCSGRPQRTPAGSKGDQTRRGKGADEGADAGGEGWRAVR